MTWQVICQAVLNPTLPQSLHTGKSKAKLPLQRQICVWCMFMRSASDLRLVYVYAISDRSVFNVCSCNQRQICDWCMFMLSASDLCLVYVHAISVRSVLGVFSCEQRHVFFREKQGKAPPSASDLCLVYVHANSVTFLGLPIIIPPVLPQLNAMTRVGQNHTFIGIYGIFSREITIHTVIYGVYIWFWPTLIIFLPLLPQLSAMKHDATTHEACHDP